MGKVLDINYFQGNQVIANANIDVTDPQFRYSRIDEEVLSNSVNASPGMCMMELREWYDSALASIGALAKTRAFDAAGWYGDRLRFVCVAKYSNLRGIGSDVGREKVLVIKPLVAYRSIGKKRDLSRINAVRYMTHVCSWYAKGLPCEWLSVEIPLHDEEMYFKVGYRTFDKNPIHAFMEMKPSQIN